MINVSSSAANATGQTVPAGGSGQPSGTSACSVLDPEKPSEATAQLPVARSTSASAKLSKVPGETGAPWITIQVFGGSLGLRIKRPPGRLVTLTSSPPRGERSCSSISRARLRLFAAVRSSKPGLTRSKTRGIQNPPTKPPSGTKDQQF